MDGWILDGYSHAEAKAPVYVYVSVYAYVLFSVNEDV